MIFRPFSEVGPEKRYETHLACWDGREREDLTALRSLPKFQCTVVRLANKRMKAQIKTNLQAIYLESFGSFGQELASPAVDQRVKGRRVVLSSQKTLSKLRHAVGNLAEEKQGDVVAMFSRGQ